MITLIPSVVQSNHFGITKSAHFSSHYKEMNQTIAPFELNHIDIASPAL